MIRQPPKNPFKVEEIEPQIEETALPPMPDRVELNIPSEASKTEEPKVKEETVKGNGHDAEAGKQAVEDTQTDDEKEAAKKEKDDAEALARDREEAEDSKIPGSGSLFNVKKKHLPEFTRLNEREVFTFAVGNVQDYVLRRADTGEEVSVYEHFRDSIFRLKISLKGEGRAENVAVRQVDAEEKANAARGAMNGI